MKDRSHPALERTREFLLEESGEPAVAQAIEKLAGIAWHSLGDDGRRLRVGFDLAVVSQGDIEEALENSGCRLRQDAWRRLKSVWYRFVDGNARANATAKKGACCSRPAGIYKSGN